MEELAKRLEPKKEVLRELFLKSGNECAFPGCHHKIISRDGVMIAQICHIEAAERGGPRFNGKQTNEDRRAFSNLMLMCHAHHKITDDKEQYKLERLQEIKRQHEERFTDVVSTILDSLSDQTEKMKVKPSSSLQRINKILKWNLDGVYLDESLQDVNKFSERLRLLPIGVRQIYCIIVKRATYARTEGFHISFHEIELCTGATKRQLTEIIQVLFKYGFVDEGGNDDMNLPTLIICNADNDWRLAEDLRTYCEEEDFGLDEVLVGLNFSLLD